MKFYTGIGSRQTPESVRPLISKVANWCLEQEYTLRSGSAPGADKMFEEATRAPKEIYIPWFKFFQSYSNLIGCTDEAMEFSRKFHPAWTSLSLPVKMIMGRNAYQVLGLDLKSPTSFVICWTPDGQDSGGTGQAIRIARHYNIPVFNLHGKTLKEAMSFLKNVDLL